MFTPRLQKLYCTNIIETIPGDGINERSEQFARTQPMVAPTFAKLNAEQHAFFVPAWQIHDYFDDFITGGEKGDFAGKLPYVTVDQIYDLVHRIITCGELTAMQFFNIVDSASDATVPLRYYNRCLEYAQSIIEHCDLLRAVPFTLPDFVQSPLSAAAIQGIFAANKKAFEDSNSQLNGCSLRVNLLPFAAYLKVWCEYFRDENLCENIYETIWENKGFKTLVGSVSIDSYIVPPADFTDIDNAEEYFVHVVGLFGVQKRAWKKDYFTAALPFTQKGPEVLIPLAGTFPVDFHAPEAASGPSDAGTFIAKAASGDAGLYAEWSGTERRITGSTTLDASGLGATIQDLRRAFRLEEFYEADARGGNRYPENTLMQFGVRTPDSRLPRAIFLGSNSSPIQISEVVQTSATSGQPTPQGTLAGKGVSYGNNRLSRYYYTMHGFLLNFYSVRVHAVYEQGIHPMFSRYDRTEYAWPRFAHLGEQPVYTKELFVNASSTETEVFGYEPRYCEYKSEKSSIHGTLKGSLNFWTMSRRFGSKPVLNEEFIYNSPRLDNFAVTNPLVSPLIVEIDYRVRANRKLPFFGVPML